MGLAIGAYDSRPVDCQDDMLRFDGGVMDQLVTGALQEGGIDREHRNGSLGAHAAGKAHSVFLGDSHIVEPSGSRIPALKFLQAGAIGHGGSNHGDLWAGLGQLTDAPAECPGNRESRGLERQPAFQVKGADSMVFAGVFHSGTVAHALGGVHMDHTGAGIFPGRSNTSRRLSRSCPSTGPK